MGFLGAYAVRYDIIDFKPSLPTRRLSASHHVSARYHTGMEITHQTVNEGESCDAPTTRSRQLDEIADGPTDPGRSCGSLRIRCAVCRERFLARLTARAETEITSSKQT